jgi:pimeloyl-ACP methyl ester carboxylesterase
MAFTKKVLTAGLIVGGAVGAITIYNKMTETMAGEPATVLTGEERRYPWKHGDMFYQVQGDRTTKPLVLLHGLEPGASSYEWRKNVESLSRHFRIYTLDLLGFGLSDRPAIDYTPEIYTDLIVDFLREVVGKPAIVVAHGLTCAYVISGAYRHPHLFERLVLIEPTPTMLQETYISPLNSAWKTLLRVPVLGTFIYNLLSSRKAIYGHYDQQGYHNPGLISDEIVEYTYTSAHQSNASYPMASLLSNHLALDVYEPLARLQIPVIALWGREGLLTPTEASTAFKRVNPAIEVRIIDKSSYHLQDEQAENFNNQIKEFAATAIK